MNKENKFKTPILIIAWKRPKQTKELIKKVKEINPYKLYIACDGPKNENPIEDNKVSEFSSELRKIIQSLRRVNEIFSKMPDKCDPYIYYHRVRPYIFGTKDNPDLKKGLIYENQFDISPNFLEVRQVLKAA